MAIAERPDEELSVADLVALEGCSRWTAARKMHRIMREDPGAVFLRGRELVGWASRMRPYVQGLRKTPLEAKVERLEGNLRDLRKRVDGQALDAREFRRLSSEWFKRLEGLERRVLNGGSK